MDGWCALIESAFLFVLGVVVTLFISHWVEWVLGLGLVAFAMYRVWANRENLPQRHRAINE